MRILVPSLFCLAAIAAEESSTQAQLAELQRQQERLSERLGALERHPHAAPTTLLDLSLNLLTVAGGSSASDSVLGNLQGGGHDPKRSGFTLQNTELSLSGAVDPFFSAEAHVILFRDEPSGETVVELEEVFARTTALPAGLEAKVGLYLMEFGRFNPMHPHAWQFVDQSLIITRIFGGDGQRTPGARLLYSLPTSWLSEMTVGVMDANGETAPSFYSNSEVGAIAGRPYVAVDGSTFSDLLYQARWTNAFDLPDTLVKFGLSLAIGRNAAGKTTNTTLTGADLALRWHPAGGQRGWPFVLIEAEIITRSYQADAADLVDGSGAVTGRIEADTLQDSGFVAQGVWGFTPGWAAGLRGEQSWGSGDGVATDAAGNQTQASASTDPTRDDRTRLAALLSWQPSEFTHFRLQYNQDRAQHLTETEHSVWLGFEFLLGAHPAHTF